MTELETDQRELGTEKEQQDRGVTVTNPEINAELNTSKDFPFHFSFHYTEVNVNKAVPT